MSTRDPRHHHADPITQLLPAPARLRDTHVKTQAVVKGTLTVSPGLPDDLSRARSSVVRPQAYTRGFPAEDAAEPGKTEDR